jgi:oligoendopeptidase F
MIRRTIMSNNAEWSLSSLVNKPEVESIKQQLKAMVEGAEDIREQYHNTILTFDAYQLHTLLVQEEEFTLQHEAVKLYCQLRYAADSTDPIAQQLHEAARQETMRASQALAFLSIEIGQLLTKHPDLLTHPTLIEYQHYMEYLLQVSSHLLSEDEERLIILKDTYGIDAWELLQSDWLSTRTFTIEIDGKATTLPYGTIIKFYHSDDRELRKRAHQIVYHDLGDDEIIWASALRAVCSDHIQMSQLRKYPTVMSQSLIANDVEQSTVDSLLTTIHKHVSLYQQYLRLKAQIMGLDKLANYDITAPLPAQVQCTFTWDDAQCLIVDMYQEFDSISGDWVERMFTSQRIDSAIRKGKESGAFCEEWLSGKTAFILQSFHGSLRDVYTLAHEMGHAIHAHLYSRAQTPSNCEPGNCLAEIGSIFSELLLTQKLLSNASSQLEKQIILMTVLDEFGMTAYQVSARVFFEQSLYNAIQRGTFLNGETIAQQWVNARDAIYGDAVEWLDEMKWEWTMKPHYYMANYRFYNYPYVFAQLFVFALYKLYTEEKHTFVPKIKRLLAAGSSKSPRDLGIEMGFDIMSEVFWEKGIDQARLFIERLKDYSDIS